MVRDKTPNVASAAATTTAHRVANDGSPECGPRDVEEVDPQDGQDEKGISPAATRVQIMTRDNGLMIELVRDGSLEMSRQIAGRDAVLALYIDCAGRGSARSGAPVEEAEVMLETFDAPVPLIGFYSGVEIAPVNGAQPLARLDRRAHRAASSWLTTGAGGMRRDELERELNYYRREYNDLGARVLRLQEEQSKAFREARRSRTVAKLIREAYRLVDRASVTDEIGTLMLEIIVDNTMCDRTAILRQLPNDGHFAVTHVLGFGQEPAPVTVTVPSAPVFFFTTSQTRLEPPAYQLTGILRLPYILWAFDPSSGYAMISATAPRAMSAGRSSAATRS